ncbi:MAG: rhodanese-like domain-containing protein [Chitinophagales bacterium]|nr:rhodanese-like domain-containing protein [Chitinophagales bacterium]
MKNFLFLAFINFSFLGCAQNKTEADYKNLDIKTFAETMNAPNVVIIDVRTPEEFAAGHIPTAKSINLNDKDFSTQLDALDKSKIYLVYCQKGGRSANASKQMTDKGFKQVYNLENGFSQWNGAVEK